MTTTKINLKRLRDLAATHTSRFPIYALLDEIKSLKAALEEIADADRLHSDHYGSEQRKRVYDAAVARKALVRHKERFE